MRNRIGYEAEGVSGRDFIVSRQIGADAVRGSRPAVCRCRGIAGMFCGTLHSLTPISMLDAGRRIMLRRRTGTTKPAILRQSRNSRPPGYSGMCPQHLSLSQEIKRRRRLSVRNLPLSYAQLAKLVADVSSRVLQVVGGTLHDFGVLTDLQ